MAAILSFHDSMTLDRGIVATLQSPEASAPLPSSRLAPPGALRGSVEESHSLASAPADRMLDWAAQAPRSPVLLQPGEFQSALGAAIKRLGQLPQLAADPGLQAVARSCARLAQDQLQLIRLAEFNRNALVQG